MRTVVMLCVMASVLPAGAADLKKAPGNGDAQITLSWDNGIPGNEFQWYTGSNTWCGNDFSISTISSYNFLYSASIYYSAPGWPNGNWEGNLLAIFGFGGGTPGSMLWGPQYIRGSGSGGWNTFYIGWNMGSVQNFLVAYSQLYNYPNCDGYTLDSGGNGGHSWYYYQGVWARLSSLGYGNGALMLRCTVDDSYGASKIQPSSVGRVKALYY